MLQKEDISLEETIRFTGSRKSCLQRKLLLMKKRLYMMEKIRICQKNESCIFSLIKINPSITMNDMGKITG